MGPRLIWLVPEQASLQSERLLLGSSGLAGMQRAEVLSFNRLVQRIHQELPQKSGQPLSAAARTMVLQNILQRRRNDWQYYQSGRFLPGLVSSLAEQIEELLQSVITPDALVLQYTQRRLPDTLQAKLTDLALLYREYLQFLDQGFTDPARQLELLSSQLSEVPWLNGAKIWVDGFAHFSTAELLFLVLLVRISSSTEIALLLDPTAPGVVDDRPPNSFSLFAPIEQTYQRLRQALQQAGVRIEPPIILRAEGKPTRPAELQHLEQHLFKSPVIFNSTAQAIRLCVAANRRSECRWVARQIQALVQRPLQPLRYRQIGVMVRDLEGYTPLLQAAFGQLHIPMFIDRRPPMREHPLGAILRQLLQAISQQWSLPAVRPLLKYQFPGVARQALDALENYLLLHNIEGVAAWTTGDWQGNPDHFSLVEPIEDSEATRQQLEQLNRTRRQLVELLEPWLSRTLPRQQTGRWWAEQLWATMRRLQIGERVEHWAQEADDDGETEQAQQHRRTWAVLVNLLDDFVLALSEQTLTAVEMCAILQSGLNHSTTGLIPPALDQVLVGTIDRSRQSEVGAVFLLGFNDGQYPREQAEPAILNDADRHLLRQADLEIDPPRRERLHEERLLAYIAATRPAEQLLISWCTADDQGRALAVSPYLEMVTTLFTDLPRETAGNTLQQLEELAGPADVVEALARYLQQEQVITPQADDQKWIALYEQARCSPDLRSLLSHTLAGLTETNRAEIDPALRSLLTHGPLQVSITQLEAFAACPFRHFAQHTLRLKPRATSEQEHLQLGSLDHHLLDQITRQLMAENNTLSSLNDDELDQRLRQLERTLQHQANANGPEANRPASYLWERIHAELSVALQMHRTLQQAGGGLPRASELAFGLPAPDALSAVPLSTPGGRKVFLCGRIDRLDLAQQGEEWVGFIYDYKRTRVKRMPWGAAFHGISLQLLIYLYCVQSLAHELTGLSVRPAGTFFLPLIPDFQQVEHPTAAGLTLRDYRPRGLYDVEALASLDRHLQEKQHSNVVSAYRDKNGQASTQSQTDAVTREDLQHLLRRVAWLAGRYCDEILEGRIEVAPYRLGNEKPCTHCDYRAFCRFEYGSGRLRTLNPLNKQQMLEALRDE
ncbi:MAG: ATP-dependent helicase/deoxyribonuclease subunit B [Phycisphaerae bacterium]|nr:ATP-dependent helicase/deoxyribonuclease subunit B [Phycisphaerae bacterium]